MDSSDSVAVYEKEKDDVGRKLIVKLAEGIRDKLIGTFEAQFVSKQIVERFKQISTKEELKLYIHELNQKWPLFDEVLSTVGQAQEIEQKDQQEIVEARKEITDQVNQNQNA